MIKLNYKIPSFVGSFKTFSAVFFYSDIFFYIYIYCKICNADFNKLIKQ